MFKGIFRNLNKKKVKRFLLFLTLATIFWVFTKFSREFTASLNTKIEYSNIPETTALSENTVRDIDFDLTANGFEILYYKVKKPSIEINIEDYLDNNGFNFEIPNKNLIGLIGLKFGSSRAIKNLSIEDLKVQLDPIVLKSVPIKALKSISYKNGFKAVDSLRFTPDSVLISGPKKLISEIEYVETEHIEIKNVDRNISRKVAISKPSKDVIAIKPQEVTANLKVAEFSQGEFTLPVEIVNLPPNIEIKLVPSTITLKFDVSVDEFADLTKDNFRIVCDYSKMNKEGKFMIPFLESKPENIYNIVFEPKKIDLLIVK